MSEIEALQGRIMAAMDQNWDRASKCYLRGRTGRGRHLMRLLEVRCARALEEEKLVTAQLEERIKKLKAAHAEELELRRRPQLPASVPDADKLAAFGHRTAAAAQSQ